MKSQWYTHTHTQHVHAASWLVDHDLCSMLGIRPLVSTCMFEFGWLIKQASGSGSATRLSTSDSVFEDKRPLLFSARLELFLTVTWSLQWVYCCDGQSCCSHSSPPKKAAIPTAGCDEGGALMLKISWLLPKYLWTKCHLRNRKHCATHYIIQKATRRHKKRQCVVSPIWVH